MHHLTLFVFLILLVLVAGEELVHLFFTHVAEAVAWAALLLLAVGGFYLACWAAYPVWVWFRNAIGPVEAHAIVDPLTVIAVFAVPLFVIIDADLHFEITSAAFRGLWRIGRPSTWRAWWCRYRIVGSPAARIRYAPWLWVARLRAAHAPGCRIQERQI